MPPSARLSLRVTGEKLIKHQTLFIVGAGASAEFGLPIGSKLTTEIANALNFADEPSSDITRNLKNAVNLLCQSGPGGLHEVPRFLERGRFIRSALPQASSIDAFVENQKTYPEVAVLAKLAIGACILGSETASSLYIPPKIGHSRGFPDARSTWLAKLFTLMVTGCTSVQDIFKNVTFIVFNYDRCLEHFFRHAISNYFDLPIEKASRIASTCRIIHPYGLLGSLDGNGHVEFGWDFRHSGGLGADVFNQMAKSIRTFSEFEEDKSQVNLAKRWVVEASRIIFLGFGFHEQNIDMLDPKITGQASARHLRATVYEQSRSNQAMIESDLLRISCGNVTNRDIGLTEGTCSQLIDNESLFLTR